MSITNDDYIVVEKCFINKIFINITIIFVIKISNWEKKKNPKRIIKIISILKYYS